MTTVIFDSFDDEPTRLSIEQVSDALLEMVAPRMPEAQAELDRRRAAQEPSGN